MANAPVRDLVADLLITQKNSARIVIDYRDNGTARTPTSTKTYDGTGWINSGLLAAPSQAPSSFSLTFTKPGRYVCWGFVHDEAHQKGSIIVT